MENIFVQNKDRVYQLIAGIHMGANHAPLITDLFLRLILLRYGFKSNLNKSKKS